MLVISNRPRASRLSDFKITRAITPWIVLHSVQLLLVIIKQETLHTIINLLLRGRMMLILTLKVASPK